MRSPASAAAAPASRAPKFIRPKFERMPVELKQLKNWVLLGRIEVDKTPNPTVGVRRKRELRPQRRSDVMHSRATDRRSASKCQENGQIRPSTKRSGYPRCW